MELQLLQQKIFDLRGHKVMFDFHLAELCQVETRVLKQSVKRNMERFPDDFMFELSKQEFSELITNCDNLPPNLKYSPVMPYAFTEQGVAMLSSVLRSEKAIEMNISVMRAFVVTRRYYMHYKQLEALEQKVDGNFKDIYEAINYLLAAPPQQEREPIGFNRNRKN